MKTVGRFHGTVHFFVHELHAIHYVKRNLAKKFSPLLGMTRKSVPSVDLKSSPDAVTTHFVRGQLNTSTLLLFHTRVFGYANLFCLVTYSFPMVIQ